MQQSRRRMLVGTAGVLTAGSLAGCLNGEEDPETEPDGEPETEGDVETGTVSFLVESAGGHDHDHDDHDHDDHDHDDHDHDDHDHDDHDHDDHDHDDHDHDDNGYALSEHDIDHACGHKEFDEPESLEAGSSADDAPVVTDTHQPYDVTIEGDSGYVAFEVDDDDDHDHDDHDHDDHDHDDHDHDDHDHDDHDHDDHDHDDHDHDDDHDDHDHDDDHNDHDHDDDNDHDHGGGDTFAFFTHGGSVSAVEGELLHEEHGVDDCHEIDEYVVVELDHGRAVLELTAE